jgi:hypothetical protein
MLSVIDITFFLLCTETLKKTLFVMKMISLIFSHCVSLSHLWIKPCGLFQFRIISEIMNHRHMVGLLGRVISSSQGLYLYRTTQHKKTRTNIHAISGIQTHDPVYERSRPTPQTARPLDRPHSVYYI